VCLSVTVFFNCGAQGPAQYCITGLRKAMTALCDAIEGGGLFAQEATSTFILKGSSDMPETFFTDETELLEVNLPNYLCLSSEYGKII
jgi:hypothetical protein